jgi:hypothetical protein
LLGGRWGGGDDPPTIALIRPTDSYGSEGWGFDSLPARYQQKRFAALTHIGSTTDTSSVSTRTDVQVDIPALRSVRSERRGDRREPSSPTPRRPSSPRTSWFVGGCPRREHVESFIEDLETRFKPATVGVTFRSLQQLFKWLLEEGEITSDPMARMRSPSVSRGSARGPDDAELRALLKACEGSATILAAVSAPTPTRRSSAGDRATTAATIRRSRSLAATVSSRIRPTRSRANQATDRLDQATHAIRAGHLVLIS